MPTLRSAALGAMLAPLWLALGVAACSKAPAPRQAAVIPVTVATVTTGAAPNILTANGMVEPMQTANVVAQVAGLVTSVAFREGDMVQKGQVLFRIDPRPYAALLKQAQDARARDEATAIAAAADARRYAALVTQRYVTPSQAESIRATAAAAAATVQLDVGAIEAAQFNLENTVIRAPITGRTGSLLVRQGNYVQANPQQPLVTVNQIDPILVRFEVQTTAFSDVQRYRRGGTLPVRVVPEQGRGDTLAGTLIFVDNAVDTLTGTVMLKGSFANPRGLLWPGQFVVARLQLDVQQGALLVPAAAVQAGQQGSFVFVVGRDNKAAMQPVTTGRAVGTSVVVLKGLTAGQRVVADGQSRLGPGVAVHVTDSSAAPPLAARTTP
jgi:multidrug efflux system membrane fusion protein